MSILYISIKNLLNKPLNSLLNLLLLALGTGIISLLFILNSQLSDKFTQNIKNVDLVIGGKGSPLQLILSSVYHIDAPTGNIKLAEANRIAKHPMVKSSIPLSYGDNYQGYRIVGTKHSYVKHFNAEINSGKLWNNPFEATLGALVAERSGLKVGDSFTSSHGLDASDDDSHSHDPFIVTGILKPTGTVVDQLILTELSSIWNLHNHGEKNSIVKLDSLGNKIPLVDEREITAMLLKFISPMGNITIPRMVNEKTNMQAAAPAIEVSRLLDLMGIGIETLRLIAILIVVISAISVFVSLYNSLKERKYEMALMRSMGAKRRSLFTLVAYEGLILAFIGSLIGLIFSRTAIYILSKAMDDSYNYQLNPFTFLSEELYLVALTLIVGILAAIIPAIKASNIDISKTLSNA